MAVHNMVEEDVITADAVEIEEVTTTITTIGMKATVRIMITEMIIDMGTTGATTATTTITTTGTTTEAIMEDHHLLRLHRLDSGTTGVHRADNFLRFHFHRFLGRVTMGSTRQFLPLSHLLSNGIKGSDRVILL